MWMSENGNENSVIGKLIVTRIRWIDKKYANKMVYVVYVITFRKECE